MKAKFIKTFLFIVMLIGLQQGIAWSNSRFDQLEQQTLVINLNEIDPSALFYMESDLALAAEKAVRKKIK